MSQIYINHPAVLETKYALGETTLIADAAQIVSLCQHLKENEKFKIGRAHV